MLTDIYSLLATLVGILTSALLLFAIGGVIYIILRAAYSLSKGRADLRQFGYQAVILVVLPSLIASYPPVLLEAVNQAMVNSRGEAQKIRDETYTWIMHNGEGLPEPTDPYSFSNPTPQPTPEVPYQADENTQRAEIDVHAPAVDMPPSAREPRIHTVRPGESLYKIATQYGMSVDALLGANPGLTVTSTIYVGDTISIP